MEKTTKYGTLTGELGITNERALELMVMAAHLFAQSPTHSEMLKKLVCDFSLDTKELVFCSFTIGALKDDPKMVANILMLDTAEKLGFPLDPKNLFE